MQVNDWRRNLAALWVGQMLSIAGFSFFFPLLPLFVQYLGARETIDAVRWAGIMNATSSLAMTVVQPYWGILADRWGRKPMVLRSMVGSGVTTIVMGLVGSPEQLLILYLIQGTVTGTVAACTALVASSTPKQHLGLALGMLQVSIFVGSSCGPLGGGLLADAFGYRSAFFAAGALLIAGAGIVAALVQEDFTPSKTKATNSLWVEGRSLLGIALFPFLVAVIFMIQFANTTMSPVISLFIADINKGENVATVVGMVMGITGAMSAASAFATGRLGDRIGHSVILLVCLAGSAIAYFPQSMAVDVWQLLLLRMLMGAFLGGLMPSANALVAGIIPRERRGAAFGITSSATAFSHAVGPIFGAAIASVWGIRAVFLATGIVFAATFFWAGISFRRQTSPSSAPRDINQ